MSSRQRWTLVLVCTAVFMFAAGHHRGERGAAIDSAGSAGEPAGPAMGERRLCPGAGRAAAAAGGPPWVTGWAGRRLFPGRPGHLHRRVAGVCAGPDRAGARVVSRALQGVGGAVLFATAIRARWPAGVLTDNTGAGRSIFFINLPIGQWRRSRAGMARLSESRDPAGGPGPTGWGTAPDHRGADPR